MDNKFRSDSGSSSDPISASWKQVLGRRGEEAAAEYLLNSGYRILAKNQREGRKGELDLIAESCEGDLIFVEVKTVGSLETGDPLEKITLTKQKQIQRTALRYCHRMGWLNRSIRFDAIGVQWSGEQPILNHIVNAFIPSLSGYQIR